MLIHHESPPAQFLPLEDFFMSGDTVIYILSCTWEVHVLRDQYLFATVFHSEGTHTY